MDGPMNDFHVQSDSDGDLSPLTANLGSSQVDPSRLISEKSPNTRPIGMENFRSKKVKMSPKSPVPNLAVDSSMTNEQKELARRRWKAAALKIRLIKDPWYEFHIEKYAVETVVRHRYNPIKKTWSKDECLVKMESKQFAAGAMRACFRLKKLSNFSHYKTWNHASNYVAKSYKDESIARERYFDDVCLQMDAKLWAEVYNKHNPPKKIDIMQMSILEFVNRPNSPLFHLEHYIEGNYIKYNSNAGFVEDLHMRLTPHAFSHFTFEYSNHELIVVDIQGVGDLYTDPQIHTAKGSDYGDGNLGVRGFALFFYSHVCNDLCKRMGLTEFDLSPQELQSHSKILDCMLKSSCTKFRPLKRELSNHSHEHYSARTRYLLSRLSSSDENSNDLYDMDDMDLFGISNSSSTHSNNNHYNHNSSYNMSSINSHLASSFISNYSDNTSIMDSPFDSDDALKFLMSGHFHKPRASCMIAERNHLLNADTEFRHRIASVGNDGTYESVLGRVHLEMCKYHEFGRFLAVETDAIDIESAFYHLEHAARLGIAEAVVNISKIYMQMPHDLLADYKMDETDENYEQGFDYMLDAAEKGEKYSLHYAAKAFDTGIGLPSKYSIDWNKALEYYRRILRENCDGDKCFEDAGYCDMNADYEPAYMILARIGEIYLEGRNGVDKNAAEAVDLFTEAAEKAIQFGKGRLANKYYELAERARSEEAN